MPVLRQSPLTLNARRTLGHSKHFRGGEGAWLDGEGLGPGGWHWWPQLLILPSLLGPVARLRPLPLCTYSRTHWCHSVTIGMGNLRIGLLGPMNTSLGVNPTNYNGAYFWVDVHKIGLLLLCFSLYPIASGGSWCATGVEFDRRLSFLSHWLVLCRLLKVIFFSPARLLFGFACNEDFTWAQPPAHHAPGKCHSEGKNNCRTLQIKCM